jgi:hypothetical protein
MAWQFLSTLRLFPALNSIPAHLPSQTRLTSLSLLYLHLDSECRLYVCVAMISCTRGFGRYLLRDKVWRRTIKIYASGSLAFSILSVAGG